MYTKTLLFYAPDMTLSYITSMRTHIAGEQMVLYYTVIYYLLYNCNSLIWLTCLVEVVSTCSRQLKFNVGEKNLSNNILFCIFLNGKSNKQTYYIIKMSLLNKQQPLLVYPCILLKG